MVKSDSHMERIRQRLLDESAGMKRSEEKRKEREGKTMIFVTHRFGHLTRDADLIMCVSRSMSRKGRMI